MSLGDAGALLVERRERVLRFRIAGVGGDAKQFRGAFDVLRQRLSVEIEQRQIIGRLRVAELGRGRQQLHRLLAVDRAAAPGEPEHGEREHALAVAAVGGAPVPLGGLGVVALDAHRIGVEFAEHGHRLGIAVELRAVGRQIERGLVLAALIGAVHQVDVGILEDGAGVTVAVGAGVAAGFGVAAGAGFLAAAGGFGFAFSLGFSFFARVRPASGRREAAAAEFAPWRLPGSSASSPEIDSGTQDLHFRRYPCSALTFPDAAACACLMVCSASFSAAAAPRGSAQMKSPTRTKSAPAAANSRASSQRRRIADAGRLEQLGPPFEALGDRLDRGPAAPRHRVRRTARNPRRLRPRPSNRAASTGRRRRRCGRVSATAAPLSMASMPVRCAPSAPARATSSTWPSSSSAAPPPWITGASALIREIMVRWSVGFSRSSTAAISAPASRPGRLAISADGSSTSGVAR